MNDMEIAFCRDVLLEVGEELVRNFNIGVHSRNVTDMVRRFKEANGSASDKIQRELSQKLPNVRWLDAEFDTDKVTDVPAGDFWLCDPIDGALNFLQGIPFWSLSLCLLRDGKPHLCFIYDACRKELFHACAGHGAVLNGSAIKVSATEDIADAILTTAHPTFIRDYKEDTIKTARNVFSILPESQAVRMMGAVSLQLAYVANGRFDGYWEHGFDMYDWWAGALLTQEAGAVVTDTAGNEIMWGSTGIIAANSALHSQLKKKLSL